MTLAPKRKFAFKKKQQASSPAIVENDGKAIDTKGESAVVQEHGFINRFLTNSNEATHSYSPQRLPDSTHHNITESISQSSRSSGFFTVTRRSSEFIKHTIDPTVAGGQSSALITEVTNCILNIAAQSASNVPKASVQISKTSQSLFICGAVSGPVFVSNSTGCVVVAICGQLRLHHCTECTVYLHCSSKPVIEDCTGIKLAPLPDYFVSTVHSWS